MAVPVVAALLVSSRPWAPVDPTRVPARTWLTVHRSPQGMVLLLRLRYYVFCCCWRETAVAVRVQTAGASFGVANDSRRGARSCAGMRRGELVGTPLGDKEGDTLGSAMMVGWLGSYKSRAASALQQQRTTTVRQQASMY
jgi:hypothetical protein